MENKEEELPEDSFEESFDEDVEDSDDYEEEDDAEDLFRENPLKAIFIRLEEIKELLQNEDD